VIRYGISYNHIQGGGFASFFKNGPQVASNVDSGEIAAAATGPFPGGAGNPYNYPDDFVRISNGLGFSTTKAAIGFPAGGLGPDNRISFYGRQLEDQAKFYSDLRASIYARHGPHG
jgi:hypothetical protein